MEWINKSKEFGLRLIEIRNKWKILIAIFLMGLAIRLYYCRDLGTLSWDEGAHSLSGILIARSLLNVFTEPINYASTFMGNYGASTGSLSFYPFGYDICTTISYLLFGFNDFAAKFPTMLFSLFIIHATYLLGKEVYNRDIGYAAAFFAAICPFFIGWGGRALADIPMVCLMIYALYFTLRGLKTGKLRDWLLMGISLGLAGQMKPVGFLIFPIIIGFAIFKKRDKILKNSQFLFGNFIALIIMGSYFLSGKIAEITLGDFGKHITMNVFHWFSSALTYAEQSDPTWHSITGWLYYLKLLPLQLGWIILILALTGIIYILIRKEKIKSEELFIFANVILIFFLFVFLSNKNERYTMPYLPLLCIFAAYGFDNLINLLKDKKELWKNIFYILVISLSIFSTFYVITQCNPSNYPNTGLREAASLITKNEPGLVVLSKELDLKDDDSINVQSISFYIAINDPELKYSVYWSDKIEEAKWVISDEQIYENNWKLFTEVHKDRDIYVYKRI